MRRGYASILVLALACLLAGVAWGKEYKLIDGTTIYGEVSAFDDNGVVFRLDTGGFSKRTSWTKFSQESLKDLAGNAKIKPLVEPFIEEAAPPKPKPKPIVPSEPPRVERPSRSTVFSSFTAPLGLVVLGLLYVGNLLAGYEIAVYRNRPVALVCGLSALLPLLGPLIFAVSPTVAEEGAEVAPAEVDVPEGAPGPAVVAAGGSLGRTSKRMAPPAAPTSLRVAAVGKTASAGKMEPKVFNRADYTFNRRFIETQFSGFFRIVPTEAEKDLVLVIRTAKQEYVGRRISRISSNELHLQLQHGGGTKEVGIGFGEIAQCIIRHKDDKE